jgi:hypothetical protein
MRSTDAAAMAIGLALLAGCAADLSSAVMPGARLQGHAHAFVVCQPNDDANLCALVAGDLGQHGIPVTSGAANEEPADADLRVTYEDRWAWDVTMYLLTLRLDVRDPRTNLLLATSRVYRSSLARRTPGNMVRQAVDALFAETTP